MKTLITIFLINLLQVGYSQNILGLYVDIDGKVKFWESEINLNGNTEDTVLITCGSEIIIEDLRNLQQINLTLIEPVEHAPRHGDPSNMNRTVPYQVIEDWAIINFPVNLDSTFFLQNTKSIDSTDFREVPFIDEVRGDGLSDSIVKMLKNKLTKHIEQYHGNAYPQKIRQQLYLELSVEDTVIEKQGIYDYIVDELIFYNYEAENPSRKIWYHWDYGIEVDSFKYDKKGNLIYFSREDIGSSRDEFFFKYNHNGQVILIESKTFSTESDPIPYNNYSWEPVKFSYNAAGIMNSKSQLGSDGRWTKCYYEIKKGVATQK